MLSVQMYVGQVNAKFSLRSRMYIAWPIVCRYLQNLRLTGHDVVVYGSFALTLRAAWQLAAFLIFLLCFTHLLAISLTPTRSLPLALSVSFYA